MQIYAAVNPENVLKTDKLIKDEINLLLQEGITEQELERAKTQLVKGLYMSLEGNQGVMSINARRMLKEGQLLDVEKEVQLVKDVTREDVRAVANEIFAQNYALSYVGKAFDGFKNLK